MHVLSKAPLLARIWGKYGVSHDVDSAKNMAAHIHIHNIHSLSEILVATLKNVSNHVERLEKYLATIPDDESEVNDGEMDKDKTLYSYTTTAYLSPYH